MNFINVVSFFAIIIFCIRFYIHYVVRQNGYKGGYLFPRIFGDLEDLHSLVNKEQDTSKKRYFKNLLYAFYISWVVGIVGIIIAIFVR